MGSSKSKPAAASPEPKEANTAAPVASPAAMTNAAPAVAEPPNDDVGTDVSSNNDGARVSTSIDSCNDHGAAADAAADPARLVQTQPSSDDGMAATEPSEAAAVDTAPSASPEHGATAGNDAPPPAAARVDEDLVGGNAGTGADNAASTPSPALGGVTGAGTGADAGAAEGGIPDALDAVNEGYSTERHLSGNDGSGGAAPALGAAGEGGAVVSADDALGGSAPARAPAVEVTTAPVETADEKAKRLKEEEYARNRKAFLEKEEQRRMLEVREGALLRVPCCALFYRCAVPP